jgi:hypothetical protein
MKIRVQDMGAVQFIHLHALMVPEMSWLRFGLLLVAGHKLTAAAMLVFNTTDLECNRVREAINYYIKRGVLVEDTDD